MVGFKRAAFSNEAGAGSASIAHSAVKTKYAASEGLVALLEPFIDTVVICTMTALVIIIFNFNGSIDAEPVFQYGGNGEGAVLIDGVEYEGAGITSKAFAKYIPFSNVFLTIAVVLFAVSTMISWSYYGLQSWKYLFGRGKRADITYKLLFVICSYWSFGKYEFSLGLFRCYDFRNGLPKYDRFVLVISRCKEAITAISSSN